MPGRFPGVQMSEEQFFEKLRRDFQAEVSGCDARTLMKVRACLQDLVSVGRSIIPNSQGTEEAPFIFTMMACMATFGEACKSEADRQRR